MGQLFYRYTQVSTLSDLRNAASAALYFSMAAVAIAAAPRWGARGGGGAGGIIRGVHHGQTVRVGGGGTHGVHVHSGQTVRGGGNALARARVRAFVVALAAAPFVPASNVFFYVGTFIGERLLYLPSMVGGLVQLLHSELDP